MRHRDDDAVDHQRVDDHPFGDHRIDNRRVLLLLVLVAVVALPTIAALWLAGTAGDDRVVVFAPSSLASVEAELGATIVEAGGPEIEWVFAGSQSLVAQLVDGAPADVLITADRATFDVADRAGVTWDDRRPITANTLVLAVADGNPGAVTGIADLARDDLLVGVCAPDVPCGRLALEATDGRVAIASDTEETSARALTTKLAAGELDVGLIYRTDALATGLDTVAVAGLDATVTEYWATAGAEGRPVLDALETPAARAVFVAAGFVENGP